MRARFFLVSGAVGLIATAAALQACSGDDTETQAGPKDIDSGADVSTVDSAPEAAPASEDAATCDLSADFSTEIPDASIADGATTSGVCLGCAKSKCKDQVDDCNGNCSCQTLASDALQCFLANAGKPQDQIIALCSGNFVGVDTETQSLGFALVSCLQKSCKTECATDAFTDAGADADAQ